MKTPKEKSFELILFIIITIQIKNSQLSDADNFTKNFDFLFNSNQTGFQNFSPEIEITTKLSNRNFQSTTELDNVNDETDKISTDLIFNCEINNFTENLQENIMEFPWTVAILSNIAQHYFILISPGSLIHPKVVLTVAHHYQNKSINILFIRAGKSNLSDNNRMGIHQDRNIIKKIIHNDFDSTTLENNIALLILEKSFDLTENVRPICLTNSMHQFNNLQCTIAGWCKHCHKQFELRKLDVSLIQSEQCKSTTIQDQKNSSFICSDTCNIDEGSPLICRTINTNLYYQVGIIISSQQNCEELNGISYSNVVNLKSWIEKSLSDPETNAALPIHSSKYLILYILSNILVYLF